MKSKKQILNLLKEHQQQLGESFGILTITLFGSFAREEQKEGSDVDLLYELTPNSSMSLGKLIRLENYIKGILEVDKVELVRKNNINPVVELIAKSDYIEVF